MVRLLWALVLVLSLLVPAASVSAESSCQFILGFSMLHDYIPNTVGDCIDNEAHNPLNGDGLQHTSRGLMVWRKDDNRMAFTDGATSWIILQTGVISRPNGVRYTWEPNPEKLPMTDGEVTMPIGSCAVPKSDSNGPVTVSMLVFLDQAAFDQPVRRCLTLIPDITTDRLYTYLNQHGAGGGNTLCRCQNIPASRSVFGNPTATGWHTHVVEQWGTNTFSRFDVAVVQSDRGWLIDDITCTRGGPETSVYAGSHSPCTQ